MVQIDRQIYIAIDDVIRLSNEVLNNQIKGDQRDVNDEV